VVESLAEELVKLKSHGRRGNLFVVEGGERKCMILSEDSQASPSRPSDKGSMEVKTLGCLEALARDRGSWFLIF
jgi:hypothetical protein